jgi:hypothetical protein
LGSKQARQAEQQTGSYGRSSSAPASPTSEGLARTSSRALCVALGELERKTHASLSQQHCGKTRQKARRQPSGPAARTSHGASSPHSHGASSPRPPISLLAAATPARGVTVCRRRPATSSLAAAAMDEAPRRQAHMVLHRAPRIAVV